MKIDKYICNSCGITVICRDYDVVIRRKKMCIECCGEVPMTDETLRRVELKNNPTLIVKTKEFKNKSKNLEWVPHPNNLRKETKKKKSKKKEPKWKRYRS